MSRLMKLLEESMDPNVSEHYKSSLNDRIVEVRVESAELRNCLLEMSGFMDHVTKLATASAEISYLAGAEYVSTSMCERVNSANREVEFDKTKKLEEQLLKVQAEFVQRMCNEET
uniref:Uncharacterized protein n=1 Tax=Timema poppense TaxID=170557 RepID=A0A7R9DTG9_TIMPO|nr:unnamed protein product [Timema poppensis]